MRSHRKPLIGNFPVRGFVVYGGWETKRLGDWEIGRHQPLFSPSFLWKEVPRRGGGWSRETVLPHSGKPTPPRFARLPLPEEGARMIFKEALIKSLSFAVRLSRFPTCATHLSAFLWKRNGRGGFRGSGYSREGVGFAATIPMTIHAAPFFLPPSFGRRCPEGAEVGRVKRYSHIQGSQPRLASLVCPFQRKGRE